MGDDEAFGRPTTQIGYATRMLLRILTQFGISNREVLRDFFTLCSNSSSIASSDWAAHYRRRCLVIAQQLQRLKELGYSTHILDEMARVEANSSLEDVLFNMMCRIHCNAYGIKNDEGAECGNAIFLQCAAMNHSCVPNCVITPRVDGIKVQAVKELARNTEITINYSVLDNPEQRRRYLSENYFFECKCDACTSNNRQEKSMVDVAGHQNDSAAGVDMDTAAAAEASSVQNTENQQSLAVLADAS